MIEVREVLEREIVVQYCVERSRSGRERMPQ